jgi:hypothetical protein
MTAFKSRRRGQLILKHGISEYYSAMAEAAKLGLVPEYRLFSSDGGFRAASGNTPITCTMLVNILAKTAEEIDVGGGDSKTPALADAGQNLLAASAIPAKTAQPAMPLAGVTAAAAAAAAVLKPLMHPDADVWLNIAKLQWCGANVRQISPAQFAENITIFETLGEFEDICASVRAATAWLQRAFKSASGGKLINVDLAAQIVANGLDFALEILREPEAITTRMSKKMQPVDLAGALRLQ